MAVTRAWQVTIVHLGTRDIRATKLSWNEAQTHAADIRRDYSYSNGGEGCPKIGPMTWQLGTCPPGPHPAVLIEAAT